MRTAASISTRMPPPRFALQGIVRPAHTHPSADCQQVPTSKTMRRPIRLAPTEPAQHFLQQHTRIRRRGIPQPPIQSRKCRGQFLASCIELASSCNTAATCRTSGGGKADTVSRFFWRQTGGPTAPTTRRAPATTSGAARQPSATCVWRQPDSVESVSTFNVHRRRGTAT